MSTTTPGIQPEYLDTPASAMFLGVSPITLEIWRSQGKGPAYTNLPRCIRYSLHDLREWMTRYRIESAQRERNTNERRGRPRKHPLPVQVALTKTVEEQRECREAKG